MKRLMKDIFGKKAKADLMREVEGEVNSSLFRSQLRWQEGDSTECGKESFTTFTNTSLAFTPKTTPRNRHVGLPG